MDHARSRARRALSRAASLTLLCLLVSSVSTVSAAQALPPRLSEGFRSDISDLNDTHLYGAFANFRGGTAEEHKAILRAGGLTPVADFEIVDSWYAFGPVAAWKRLISEPRIAYLQDNARMPVGSRSARLAAHVTQAQVPFAGGPYRDARNGVIDGSGIGVAVVDAGVDGTHPDMENRIAKNFKVECTTPVLVWAAGEKRGECFGDVTYAEVPDSDTSSGHGSHVAGIVAGDGTSSHGFFKGVAPGSKIYGFGAGEGASIIVLNAAGSFRWVLDNHAKPEYQNPRIRIVTNSWGDPGTFDPEDVISRLTNKLVDAGMLVLFAAGNSTGNGSTIRTTTYANNPKPGVISVANYDDGRTGNRNNTLASDSSRGLSSDATTWPDVAAPGTLIYAACHRSKTLCKTPVDAPWQPWYAWLSGTSMATPYVAGIAAMLLQADPSLTPAEVEDVLQDTAHKFAGGAGAPGAYVADPQNEGGTTSFDKGAGLVNTTAALQVVGAARTGIGFEGTPSLAISTPAEGASQDGIVTVSGTATIGATATTARTIIAGDGYDYQGAGAADIVSVTTTPGAGGVTYTIAVRDLADLPPSGSVAFGIFTFVNQANQRANVSCTATGCTPVPTASSTNTAPSTAASSDLASNSVSVFVPHSSYPGVVANTYAADTRVISYVQVAQDLAPGLLFGDDIERPAYPDPWNLNPVNDLAPAKSVELTVDDGPQIPATLTSSGSGFSWSADLDLANLPSGARTIKAELVLNGAPRLQEQIGIVIPERILTVSPDSIAFGSLRTGLQSPAQTITVSNTTQGNVPIGPASLSGAGADFPLVSDGCSNATLLAGTSCVIEVSFAPSAMGDRNATLSLQGLPQTIALSGTGIAAVVSLSSNSLTFGQQPVGTTSDAQVVTVTNTGTDSLSIGSVNTGGDFLIVADACGAATLAPSASCSIGVAFQPLAAGLRTGTLSIASDASGSPHTVALSGEGLGPPLLTTSPASVAFGNVFVSQPKTTQVTVTNAGGQPLVLGTLTIGGADPAEFSLSANGCGGATLLPLQSCTFKVTFSPTASAERSAVVSIPNNTAVDPHSVALTGTGVVGNPIGSLSPTSIAFGEIETGQASTNKTVTLRNTGTGILSVGSVTLTGTDASQFLKVNDACTGAQLGSNNQCSVTLRFRPTTGGAKSAALSFATNAAASPHLASLTGLAVVDTDAPVTRFNTSDGATLVHRVHTVTGSVTDDVSGVLRMTVRFRPTVGSVTNVVATLRCSSPRSCTWTADLPLGIAGPTQVEAFGTDARGRVESPPATINVTIV